MSNLKFVYWIHVLSALWLLVIIYLEFNMRILADLKNVFKKDYVIKVLLLFEKELQPFNFPKRIYLFS